MKLGDIYKYANETLLGSSLDNISEIIVFLQKAQDIIELKCPVKAPKFTTILTTNSFLLPADYWKLHKKGVRVNGVKVENLEKWAGNMYLPSSYTSGSLEMYYYKRATPLDYKNLNQVPDIDARYHPAMAEYAAKMRRLVGDDEQMKLFEKEFASSLAYFGDDDEEDVNLVTDFYNANFNNNLG
jgi:hypothetical protein